MTPDLNYPSTRADDVTDDYHGTTVADPYRWLEDLDSEETAAWVAAQNEVTFGYLGAIPFRDAVRARMAEVWDYERHGIPVREGERFIWTYDDGKRPQFEMRIADDPRAVGTTLLDPNEWSDDGTVALVGASTSHDGSLMAYGVSEGGSDRQVWRILNVSTGETLADELRNIKFTHPAWLPDGTGFFYGRYEVEGKFQDTNLNQQLWFHRVGTSQDEDELIHARPDHPDWMLFPEVTEDGRWLIITASAGSSSENALFISRLDTPGYEFTPLFDAFDATYSVIDTEGDAFMIFTDKDAPRGKVIAVDAADPSTARDLIPEGDHAIESVSPVGDVLFLSLLVDATSAVHIYDRSGARIGDVPLPGPGSVAGFPGRRTHTETYFSFSSFTVPAAIYRYDIPTATVELIREPNVPFDPSRFTTTEVFVDSPDGTRVPMFLTHRTDVTPDGKRPTILYGYGGFNIAVVPAFATTLLPWLEAGGVYASACIRGGSEYGEDWHKAATKLTKQNCFDDFIACAEWLIANDYTTSDKLAIKGGSNGGLLVGACITQRPELFGAAHAAVGVLDMLRYHEFTIGWAWASDYGTSADPEEFAALYAYSPLHNVRKGTAYPSTIITTGDHDDRVVPSHSFKFAATIQPAQDGPKPILLRVGIRAGHGMGKPKDKLIDEAADVTAFLMKELGVSYPG